MQEIELRIDIARSDIQEYRQYLKESTKIEASTDQSTSF